MKNPRYRLVVLSCGDKVDSNNYMVKITTKDAVAASYKPSPLDLSDVQLPDSLMELTEAIAENTHEVWSQNRLNEGWTYGP